MITLAALQITWYVLLGFLLTGFIVFDGYDLGAGMCHLLVKRGAQRDQVLASIAPFWDGNQVWLIAAGGASFAAFPPVYAALLSGLYPLLVGLLLMLILRTVAVEYAQSERNPRRRQAWDVTFGLSSTLAVAGVGLLLGNLLYGLPLDADGQIVVPWWSLFHPFALLIMVLIGSLIALHGAIWIGWRTEGELRAHARRWGLYVWPAALWLTLFTLGLLIVSDSWLTANYRALPALWALPAASVLAFALAGPAHLGGRGLLALAASSAALFLLFASAGVGMFPVIVRALGTASQSLTAFGASSSFLALEVMVIVVALGLPAVFAYTAWLHWLFRQPVATAEYPVSAEHSD